MDDPTDLVELCTTRFYTRNFFARTAVNIGGPIRPEVIFVRALGVRVRRDDWRKEPRVEG